MPKKQTPEKKKKLIQQGDMSKFNLLRPKAEEYFSNEDVFVNAFVELAYTEHDTWKNQLWGSYGRVIFENLKRTSGTIYYPFKDDNGTIEYLGEKFELKEVQEFEQMV